MEGLESYKPKDSRAESSEKSDRLRVAENMFQMYYLTKIHPGAGTFFEEISKSGASFRQWFDEKEEDSRNEEGVPEDGKKRTAGSEKMKTYAGNHDEEAIQNFDDMDDLVQSYEEYCKEKMPH